MRFKLKPMKHPLLFIATLQGTYVKKYDKNDLFCYLPNYNWVIMYQWMVKV